MPPGTEGPGGLLYHSERGKSVLGEIPAWACDSPTGALRRRKAFEAVSLALKVRAHVLVSSRVIHTGRAHYYYLTLPRKLGATWKVSGELRSRPQRT